MSAGFVEILWRNFVKESAAIVCNAASFRNPEWDLTWAYSPHHAYNRYPGFRIDAVNRETGEEREATIRNSDGYMKVDLGIKMHGQWWCLDYGYRDGIDLAETRGVEIVGLLLSGAEFPSVERPEAAERAGWTQGVVDGPWNAHLTTFAYMWKVDPVLQAYIEAESNRFLSDSVWRSPVAEVRRYAAAMTRLRGMLRGDSLKFIERRLEDEGEGTYFTAYGWKMNRQAMKLLADVGGMGGPQQRQYDELVTGVV